MAHASDLIESNIEQYLHQHEHKGLLRFITCGSVDDGKSTLIGRLLHDSKMIFEDQLATITQESKTMGKAGEGELDLALLVDGLASEREQGITIDVAYRFFSTDKRKFIIADTPGHEQYTRNMATGASTAQAAVILIDARYGVQTQTCRHSYLCNLLGVQHLVVAINKMDLVEFRQKRYEEICDEYRQFAKQLGIDAIEFIPLSALRGDNVVNRSEAMGWYQGQTLTEWLETVDVDADFANQFTRLPVQSVVRPNLDFRGFTGTLEAGELEVGGEITVLPNGKKTRIKGLYLAGESVQCVDTNQAVMVTTEDEVDISRGNMIVAGPHPLLAKRVDAEFIWMAEEPLVAGKEYLIKCGTLTTHGRVEHLEVKTNVNTMEQEATKQLALNEVGSGVLNVNDALIFDPYTTLRETGSFIVIDRLTNVTVGAGLLRGKAQGEILHAGRHYSAAEMALNGYIREHFPEWCCKEI
ncbi:MAG: sulfate adenylyltransferase subunit CysN [Motiliproteus sp.]